MRHWRVSTSSVCLAKHRWLCATPQITDTLREQQEAPLTQPFLQGLIQKATIVVNDPQFAGIFATPPAPPAAAAPPAGSPAPAATK